MKQTLTTRLSSWPRVWLLCGLLLPFSRVCAQTQVDASYGPMQIYQPATALQALQLSTGERLVLGNDLVRADGVKTLQPLLRYSATGTPDATFALNIADYSWLPQGLTDAGAGRVLVTLFGPATLNGQVHYGLVRLLPSGLPDPAFRVQPSSLTRVSSVLVQPDGKVVVAGNFTNYAGQAAAGILRLNEDGTLDQPFVANTAGGLILSGFGPVVVRQPADGKLVAGGSFRTAGGRARSGLARFNADGTLDLTFAPITTATALVGSVAVQPDGRILAATFNGTYLVPGVTQTLVRFSATGAFDNTFTGVNYGVRPAFSGGPATLLVQPDGKILAAFGDGVPPPGHVLRFTATGALDPTWSVSATPENSTSVYSLQLLAGGQVLVGSTPQVLGGPVSAVPAGVNQLLSTGALDTTFPIPALQAAGQVEDFAQQPDGKLLVVGAFSEINGSAARGLARLLANGSVDAAYTAASTITQGYPTEVVLQPDGKALVAGRFTTYNGLPVTSLVRVESSGMRDASFMPALVRIGTLNTNSITSLALQPDGGVLVAGNLVVPGSSGITFRSFQRLLPTGSIDNSFQPAATLNPTALLVQPDGRIVVGSYQNPVVQRLLPSGSTDPSFAAVTSGSQSFSINGLRRYSDGRLLVFGYFDQMGGVSTSSVARLSATGMPDPTFSAAIAGNVVVLNAAAIQPNNRILVGGTIFSSSAASSGLVRLLPDGSADASFNTPMSPDDIVLALAVQPDGALLVGGQIAPVGSNQPNYALARLLDASVLHASAARQAPRTEAWPVPAHDQLHLRLDAASRPEQVALHDALGRVVMSRLVSANEAVMTLDIATLPAGAYVLKVRYAAGSTFVRRVVKN
ncbi:T9SS type A sorting domain-containing protein [Microvirga sp. STR05]|uniref:T9SS type A sorting domain-containing protein n=1 Tax=Hymenobacter duratus TaxID=2771356 RepID=A0ABR8JK91_9BACT|nr:T9SS type A sorting domain-containing protein [Hymenobacter duratus]MBD2716517.1 T9SS type A sorting domain-containing protein [Hymenobacter duratus]MBR7951432.1 T9SS type A sorting domain-containing protein [Microvirga sp. STR05]